MDAGWIIARLNELDLAGDDPSPDEKPVRFALLSDTHIPVDAENQYRGFFPSQNLKKIVPEVTASRPEGVIIDGGTDRRPVQVGVRCLGPRAAMRTYAGGRGDARELGRSASHCDEVLKGSEVDRLGNVSE